MIDFLKSFTLFFFLIIVLTLFSSAQYSYIQQWGTCGTNDGEFNSAYDVACDTSGFVYVTDRYNHRIQKFTSTGVFRFKWGTYGTNNGEFNSPHGLTTDFEGRIAVADLENNRIQRFTSIGTYLMKFASNGAADVAVDYNGNYFVTDYGMNRVIKYDPSGNEITRWGNYGFGDGQFHSPHGIAVDGAGNVYVADQNNHRVQKFTNSGFYLKKWGTFGSGSGQFNTPIGISIDKNNDVFVADFGNNRIQKFDSAGNYKIQWGQLGSGDGKFDGPTGVDVDTNGYVYVADYNNCRVQKFQWKNLNITTIPFSGTYCRGAGLNVSFTTNDQFNTSNTFIAQLSNTSGSFTNPIEIGRVPGTGSGVVTSAIPTSVPAGTGYRIRVIGTEPYVEGSDNGSNLTITAGPNPVFLDEATNVCEDVSGNVYTTGNYNSYSWSFTGIPGYDYIIEAGGMSSSNSSTVTWLMPGTRFVQVEVTDVNGCKGVVTSSVLVKDKPLFDFNSSSTITCANQPVEFGTFSTYPNYAWYFTGIAGVDYNITGGGNSESSATVTWLTPGIKAAQLEVTSEIGCKNLKTIIVQINPLPLPAFSNGVAEVCSGVQGNIYTTSSTFSNYDWTFSGVQGIDYIIEAGAGSTNNSATMTWLTPGVKFVKVEVTNEYNCINDVQSDVIVKPSPSPVFENPRASLCQGDDWNINTTSTFTSYNWTIPGIEGTDYFKISGGTLYYNFVSIRWLTAGMRTVELEVNSENGCLKKISFEVNVYRKPSPLIYGELNPCQHVAELYTTENDAGTIASWAVIGGEIVSQNNDSLIVKWETTGQGTLKLVQTSLHGCRDSSTKIINVKLMPVVTLQKFPDACVNDSSFILSGGSPPGGVYSGDGVLNSIFIPSVSGAGNHEITYTYLHNNGCVNRAKQNITVNPQPAKPTIERIGNTLASSSPAGNQWYLNGLKMQGETKQFLNLETLGFYQVQVIDVNGCISDLSDVMQVESLGFRDIKSESGIDVFPNPVDDFINVRINYHNETHYEIKIINILSESLYHSRENLSEEINFLMIDTHFLIPGVYILCIEIGNEVYYSKIIKN
ncbi:MAG: T9SS type A sorting domain-containing protein [Bacteroidetes bacterium]|nr:T9SS type A sorting domain-containing protein [Bacteroidota bacterium]